MKRMFSVWYHRRRNDKKSKLCYEVCLFFLTIKQKNMKSAVVPKMHAKKRGKPLANKDPHQNIVTVPFVSLDFLPMWAAMVGDVDKDCLPADNHISEHFKNYKFFLHSLEKKKTKDEIIAGIEKGKDATPGRIRIAPLQVLISLMGREPI